MQRPSSSDSSSSFGTASGLAPPSPQTSPQRQQCMVVLVAAYRTPEEKTFRYVLERMGRNTGRVVTVSCLTMVPNTLGGVMLPVGSVEKKWREKALLHQFKALSFCMKNLLRVFQERQVDVLILARADETNEMIASKVAREFRPTWIIVDSSLLKGRQGEQFRQTLQNNAFLTSNLAFVSEDPMINLREKFFDASVVTSVEVTAIEETNEEHTEVNSFACGLLRCFHDSRSSSRRSFSRDREQTSFQIRKGKEKII